MSDQTELVEIGLEAARDHAAVEVEYVTSGGSTHDIDAIPGNSIWDQEQDGFVVRQMTSQDWLFEIPDEEFRPVAGDKVTRKDTGEVFEVMSPPGQRPWRYIGPSRIWVRVFSKNVS